MKSWGTASTQPLSNNAQMSSHPSGDSLGFLAHPGTTVVLRMSSRRKAYLEDEISFWHFTKMEFWHTAFSFPFNHLIYCSIIFLAILYKHSERWYTFIHMLKLQVARPDIQM